MKMDKAGAALVVNGAVQSVTLFGTVSKGNIFDLRGEPPSEAAQKDLRASMLLAVGLALGLGMVTSAITGSSTPLVVNALVAGGMYIVLDRSLATASRKDRERAAIGKPTAETRMLLTARDRTIGVDE